MPAEGFKLGLNFGAVRGHAVQINKKIILKETKTMKKTNKGFTLVELIIVIAVIGVLAAILIPTFANVIEKANRKSAFSDAKNALQIYLAENTTGEGGAVVKPNTVFEVEKATKKWYFIYQNNGLVEAGADEAIHTKPSCSDTTISTGSMENFPVSVTMYYPA